MGKWPMRFAVFGVCLCFASLTFAIGKAFTETHAINQSRLDFCQDTNKRHDATEAKLKELIAKAVVANPKGKARIQRSAKDTSDLIGLMLPKRDCQKFVAGSS